MYNNPGKKLKGIIKGIVSILMVIWVIVGLVIFSMAASQGAEGSGLSGFFVGLLITTIGCFGSWLSGLILATFADMAENLHAIRGAIANGQQTAVVDNPKIKDRVYTKRAGKNIEDYPHDKDSEWVCSSCMTVNSLDVKYCSNCGCGVALK